MSEDPNKVSVKIEIWTCNFPKILSAKAKSMPVKKFYLFPPEIENKRFFLFLSMKLIILPVKKTKNVPVNRKLTLKNVQI